MVCDTNEAVSTKMFYVYTQRWEVCKLVLQIAKIRKAANRQTYKNFEFVGLSQMWQNCGSFMRFADLRFADQIFGGFKTSDLRFTD
jgi:hypothetical protein